MGPGSVWGKWDNDCKSHLTLPQFDIVISMLTVSTCINYSGLTYRGQNLNCTILPHFLGPRFAATPESRSITQEGVRSSSTGHLPYPGNDRFTGPEADHYHVFLLPSLQHSSVNVWMKSNEGVSSSAVSLVVSKPRRQSQWRAAFSWCIFWYWEVRLYSLTLPASSLSHPEVGLWGGLWDAGIDSHNPLNGLFVPWCAQEKAAAEEKIQTLEKELQLVKDTDGPSFLFSGNGKGMTSRWFIKFSLVRKEFQLIEEQVV